MSKRTSKWIMPKWMEAHAHVFLPYDKATVEDMHNDHNTNIFVNAPRALICVDIHGRVAVMERLHEKGII